MRMERRRTLGGGMDEEVLLSNDSREAIRVRVEIECAADFKDVFEVRGYQEGAERGELVEEAEDGVLRFAYRQGEFQRGTMVRVSGEGMEALAESGCVSLEVLLEPETTCAVLVSVTLEEDGREVRRARRPALLYGVVPSLETSWEALRRSWEKSVKDLEALSFEDEEGLLVPAAGAPWYMALFGRYALIIAFQTMPLTPEPAKKTLRALARYQAGEFNDFRDAEPVKVLHELRSGELAFFGETPHSPYYGTVDVTPLLLILPRSRARPEKPASPTGPGLARRFLGDRAFGRS